MSRPAAPWSGRAISCSSTHRRCSPELAALGAAARRAAVIPHGPFGPTAPGAPLRLPGSGDQVRQLLFFGKVEEYKGVDDLLGGRGGPARRTVPVRLTVAGQCDDPALRSRLRLLARTASGRVVLRLEHVPEDEVTGLLAASDVVVLPFRRITTSGSAMLALAHGRPLVVPDLAALTELPPQAVIRYDGSMPSLAAALTDAARAASPPWPRCLRRPPRTLRAHPGRRSRPGPCRRWPRCSAHRPKVLTLRSSAPGPSRRRSRPGRHCRPDPRAGADRGHHPGRPAR